ncbi:MAG: hypothetical protein JWR74_2146 [Polaromonas sp.]|nr:hypothetical protein [Polaromonas sp.]
MIAIQEKAAMTDKELLELAAKAYWPDDEVSIRFDESEDGLIYLHADNQDHNGQDCERVWNPLTDDGDALRLATQLDIHLHFSRKHVNADAEVHGLGVFHEDFTARKEAATRRAIVRAAAAIGLRVPA